MFLSGLLVFRVVETRKIADLRLKLILHVVSYHWETQVLSARLFVIEGETTCMAGVIIACLVYV